MAIYTQSFFFILSLLCFLHHRHRWRFFSHSLFSGKQIGAHFVCVCDKGDRIKGQPVVSREKESKKKNGISSIYSSPIRVD